MQGFSSSTSWKEGLCLVFLLLSSFSYFQSLLFLAWSTMAFSHYYVLLLFNSSFRLSSCPAGCSVWATTYHLGGKDYDLESALCLSIFFAYFWTFFSFCPRLHCNSRHRGTGLPSHRSKIRSDIEPGYPGNWNYTPFHH